MNDQVVTQVVDESAKVNESATLEEILLADIMRMQHIENPSTYVANLIKTCEDMSIIDFMKMGFPIEVISIVKAYSTCKNGNTVSVNDKVIRFVSSQITCLPVVKSTRRRLV